MPRRLVVIAGAGVILVGACVCHFILVTAQSGTPREARLAIAQGFTARPTKEQARLALIGLVQSGLKDLRSGDRGYVLRILSSPEEMEKMMRPLNSEHANVIWISDWYCDLNEQQFERTFTLPGGHQLIVAGKFVQKNHDVWVAVSTELAHANTGP